MSPAIASWAHSCDASTAKLPEQVHTSVRPRAAGKAAEEGCSSRRIYVEWFTTLVLQCFTLWQLSSAAAGATPHCWPPSLGPRSPAQSHPQGGPEARLLLSTLHSFRRVWIGRAKVTCATPATDLPAALGQRLRSGQAQQVSAYHGHVIRPASRRGRGASMRCDMQCTPWCCGPHVSYLNWRSRTDVTARELENGPLPCTCLYERALGLNWAADCNRLKEPQGGGPGIVKRKRQSAVF